MEHEPEIAIHADRDTLTDAAQLAYGAAFRARKGRLRGPKKKRTVQPDAFERLTDDASFQRVYVSGDIGQLGQPSE